ncbi:DUF1501 domain-containing protein [Planctellipticum variicoloris]|uniref:DUF1501 domain-containing protein n=1 Tax=Planctellipticum variicoloris TaxID=3064265 RepID=UPI002C888148|nr:DUF1501 domain-containing protein [Planctomycetaceae bacterium SH412]HTN04463.1 DUF1501 domain-containing protein [Planctomycetaceae bacterium]
MSRGELTRRDLLQTSLASALGVTCSAWLPALAEAAGQEKNHRACILLWMAGGPTQTDTFDLKPGHENGGPSKTIETAVAGIEISEHLPGVARQMKDLAIIRSLTTQEGDHDRATRLMLTGHRPGQEGVNYPSLGSLFAKELGNDEGDLPHYVSVSPFRMGDAGGPGFLGPNYAPLVVSGDSSDPEARANLTIENLKPAAGVSAATLAGRFEVSKFLQNDFSSRVTSPSAKAHKANYERAMRMIATNAKGAFKLDEETAELRDRYGRNRFGQGCLLARRLVERGVAFVEVTLEGWDTHADNFNAVQRLCGTLDPAWSALMDDLRDRGLLESTLVVWMGEFGRTPKINGTTGRDHYPLAWSTVLGGGGVRGGQVVGSTGKAGTEVAERPVKLADLYATLCAAIGIDPGLENISPEGRPIAVVDRGGKVIEEIVKA